MLSWIHVKTPFTHTRLRRGGRFDTANPVCVTGFPALREPAGRAWPRAGRLWAGSFETRTCSGSHGTPPRQNLSGRCRETCRECGKAFTTCRHLLAARRNKNSYVLPSYVTACRPLLTACRELLPACRLYGQLQRDALAGMALQEAVRR